MTCTIGNEHAHYGNTVHHLRLGETPAPTHTIHRPVAAYPIVATGHLADGYVSVLVDGEIRLVDVPRGFASHSTPIRHDMLIIGPDGEVTHRARALFDAESVPVRSRDPQPYPGRQIASVHDVRPVRTNTNADGDRMAVPAHLAAAPMVPRHPA